MARTSRLAAALLLVAAFAVADDAAALIIPLHFEVAYEAVVVESDVPNLPVGALVPDNLLTVYDADRIEGGLLVRAGSLTLLGLLSFPLDGALVTENPAGWRFEHAVACNLCVLLWGQLPDDSTDVSASTVIEMFPGDFDGYPPDPFVSGTQTIVFVSDPGTVIGTVVAELVPAPPTALAVAVGVLALAVRSRRA